MDAENPARGSWCRGPKSQQFASCRRVSPGTPYTTRCWNATRAEEKTTKEKKQKMRTFAVARFSTQRLAVSSPASSKAESVLQKPRLMVAVRCFAVFYTFRGGAPAITTKCGELFQTTHFCNLASARRKCRNCYNLRQCATQMSYF